MVKSLLKAPQPRDQYLFPGTVYSLCKNQPVSFSCKRSGLLDTAKFKGMSQVISKLEFEVDVALIYVCKVFWREINTPAHLWRLQDSLEVKSRHLAPLCPLYPHPRRVRRFK